MNRPSHWILGSFVVFGVAAWWSGALDRPSAKSVEADASPARVASSATTPRRTVNVRDPNGARQQSAPHPKNTHAEVHGRVIDRLGYPVANATVRVADEPSVAATTDARGRFRIAASGLLHRTLRVEAPGVHDAVEVQGSVDELQVVLQDATPWRAAAVKSGAVERLMPRLLFGEGTVRGIDGAMVGTARVAIRETGAIGLTDDDGRYQLPLDADLCTLVAFDGVGGVIESDPIRVPKRQGKLPLPELRLAPGPALRGRVISPEGDPLVDVGVLVQTGGIQRVARTEADGMFVVAGLVKGDVELTVLPHSGYLGLRQSLLVERDAYLPDLKLERPQQEPLRLRVVDGTGAIQPFVHVVAEQLAGLCRAYGQADSRGQVVLAGLGSGETAFEVRGADFAPITVQSVDAVTHRIVVAP